MNRVKFVFVLMVSLVLSACGVKPSYTNHSTDYVLARHIQVKSQEHAKEIISRLDASADPLAAFIEMEQQEPRSGSLGWLGAMKMVPSFDQELFQMEVGTYSKLPVKTMFGYHVIYLEDRVTQEQMRQMR